MNRIESKINTNSAEFKTNRGIRKRGRLPQSSRLKTAVSRLVEAAHPNRIILFGSQARGDADNRSDYDFLVICKVPDDRRKFVSALLRSLKVVGFATDIVVMTPEEFESDKRYPGTIARPAWLEGKVLYESD